MHQSSGPAPHCHARRQVLLGITALAALSACGGGPRGASVTDRQIGVAPASACTYATGLRRRAAAARPT